MADNIVSVLIVFVFEKKGPYNRFNWIAVSSLFCT